MSGLLEEYLGWDSQLERALRLDVLGATWVGEVRGIAFAGMGGSGIIGDFVARYLERELEVPVFSVKSHSLPRCVGRGWLAVAVSYSGNTPETLSAFCEARRRGAWLGVVASGGRLVELAERAEVPRVLVEDGHLPRTAMPSLLAGVAKLVNELAGSRIDVGRGLEALRDPGSREGALEKARGMARYMHGGLPVFVVPEELYPLGLRAKSEVNENAKVAGKVEVLPEWGHNDIVAWEGGPRGVLRPVVLRRGPDPLAGFALDYLRELGHDPEVLDLSGRDYLEAVLYGSWIAGMSSVILAELRGVDPRLTKSIERYRSVARKLLGTPC